MAASSNKTEVVEKEEKVKVTVEEVVPKISVVFMGTPPFAATVLNELVSRGYTVVGVVTKPDKAVGRKQEIMTSAVKELASGFQLPIFQPEKLDDAARDQIREWNPDLIVVAAYGKILPKSILEIPKRGCINIHASLLPHLRGASPIQNALLLGDEKTGVTIMLMDEGMDTGDILAQESTDIKPEESRTALEERLALIGSSLLVHTLPRFIEEKIEPVVQDDTQATLCQLIDREDGRIFFDQDAQDIFNRYRALEPWPGIFCFWKRSDELLRLKLSSISLLRQSPQIAHAMGEVFQVGEKIGVQTGNGVILLETIQLEGKEPTPIQSFINGYQDFIGSTLQ